VKIGGVTVKEALRVKCFCGAEVVVGYSGPDQVPSLFHPDPACERFLRDEPLDKFLAALRIFREQS